MMFELQNHLVWYTVDKSLGFAIILYSVQYASILAQTEFYHAILQAI